MPGSESGMPAAMTGERLARGSRSRLGAAIFGVLARVATARWLPAALLAVFSISATTSLMREGATFDETVHLPAGYAHLAKSDYRLSPEHPPLARLLCAIPLTLVGASMPELPGRDGWKQGDAWSFGYDFLYSTPGNDADVLLTLGRMPVVGLGVLLGILVYVFARDVSGEAGGRMALFCLAFSPTVLAHTRLATTDVAMTLFYLATIHATYRLGRRLSPTTGAYLGMSLGFALSSKFSALLLLPVTALLLGWRSVDAVPLTVSAGHRARIVVNRLQKATVLASAFVCVAGIALGVIWASYRFQFAASSAADLRLDADMVSAVAHHLRQHPALENVVHVLKTHHLLPESFVDGFVYLVARSEGRSAYLLGQRSTNGFPLFFPIAFLVKTPLPIVLLVVPAVASLLLGGPTRAWARRCIGIAALMYLGVSLAARLNIGERHLLPLYPFVFIAIGSLAPWLDGRQARAWPRFALLAAWYVGAWAFISPHYLAYFNELAGGPTRGGRILADSNLDWGQDVKALGQWIATHGVTPVAYAHFGTTRPQYYGIDPFISLPGLSTVPSGDRAAEWTLRDIQSGGAEFVAIHLTNLHGVYLPDTMTVAGRRETIGQNYYQAFRDLEPVARIGYSINIYRNPWHRRGLGVLPR